MEGKDAIINSIISSAERNAESIVSDAIAEKDALLERVRNDLNRKESEELERAKREAELTVERRMTIAALDSKKLALAAKQEVIDKVYDSAVAKVLNMTDNVYREFIGGFVEKYADNGDEIIIAERDVKRLHYDWAESLARKLNKNITLSSKFHKGRGGVILSGAKCDKNLTLEALVKEVRPKTESGVAQKLFK